MNNRVMVEKQTYKKNKKNPRKRETYKSAIFVCMQQPLLNPRKRDLTYRSENLVCMSNYWGPAFAKWEQKNPLQKK